MEWKFIPGTDEQYSVSESGIVRSNYRWYLNPKTLTRHKKPRVLIMKQNKSKRGYMRIKLADGKLHFVHRLVASAFLGEDDDLFVNHKDGNKEHNHIDNLEWVTHQENNLHAYAAGLNSAEHVVERCAKYWKFVNPQGEVVDIYNLSEFCRDNNLTKTLMLHVNNGIQNHHKGWKKYV